MPEETPRKGGMSWHGQRLGTSFLWDGEGGKGSWSGMSIAVMGEDLCLCVSSEGRRNGCVRRGMSEGIGNARMR